jgi:hypothetical protein
MTDLGDPDSPASEEAGVLNSFRIRHAPLQNSFISVH